MGINQAYVSGKALSSSAWASIKRTSVGERSHQAYVAGCPCSPSPALLTFVCQNPFPGSHARPTCAMPVTFPQTSSDEISSNPDGQETGFTWPVQPPNKQLVGMPEETVRVVATATASDGKLPMSSHQSSYVEEPHCQNHQLDHQLVVVQLSTCLRKSPWQGLEQRGSQTPIL